MLTVISNDSFAAKLATVCILLFSLSSSLHSQEHESETNIYEVYDICDAYFEFLDLQNVSDASDCDEVSSFLICQRRQKNPHHTLDLMREDLEGQTPFDLVLGGYAALWRRTPEQAFWRFNFAATVVFTSFQNVDPKLRDEPRGFAYYALIDRTKIEILSRELPPDSAIMSTFPSSPKLDGLGDGFEILNRSPSSVVLSCLMSSDNQRVPLSRVVQSRFLKACLERHTKPEKS